MRRLYFLIAMMGLWAPSSVRASISSMSSIPPTTSSVQSTNSTHSFEVSPRRGVIYDRNGKELAVSIKVDSIFAVPDEIHNPDATARVLYRRSLAFPRKNWWRDSRAMGGLFGSSES